MSEQKRLRPFLKWAGGKRWLTPYLRAAFEGHTQDYYEPFLGSGAVFFEFVPKSGVLSDMNEDLIACYTAIERDFRGVEEELRVLSALSPDDHYYDVRASNPDTANARAARFLYLNRTCWNGLYRVNQKGLFNVPRGTKNLIELPDDDFEAVAKSLSTMTLAHCDFEETIDRSQAGDLLFCDPPYTVAHNNNGFIKYNQTLFSWEDQRRLAACLVRASVRDVIVIATNADHADVRDLYRHFGHLSSLSRASVIAGSSLARKRTSELLIVNQSGHDRVEGVEL